MKAILTGLLMSATLAAAPLYAQTPTPEGARAYIISPQDGDTVPQTFTVRFGLSGMGVAPAGTDREGTGHHHLLIDRDELPEAGKAMDASVMHFGAGQTETELTLPPGRHSLQLLLGDMNHVPHDPPVVSEKITVTVE
ncbi:DUF4399 domain-containing protein [Marinobacterium aestuariivivens]|uniref:DUF4399 domain-containing protein n=1 Tax=Marinobacterium aestuariivivens TaxID=1698799 RepID=A0ABW2A1W8_9GAMM